MVLEPIWGPQNAGADVHAAYHGVSFVNPCTGWAVGVGDVIVATTDGQNWTIQRPSDQVGFLLDVSFVDELTGWAVGTGGLILATTDGGMTWQQQNTSDPLRDDLWGVSFVDGSHGWVVGQHTVLATNNGGASWTPQLDSTNLGPLPADPLFSLHDVCFVDSSYGWAVGDEGVIITTNNGGASWTQQVSGVSQQNFFNLFGVSFLDRNIGWAVGAGGTIDQPQGVILHTDTGGMNWIRKDVPAGTPTLLAVSATDSTSAWVVGDGDTILSTTDSGGTWKQNAILFPVPGNHIYDVSRYGWAVGYGGTILRVMYREACQ
jgi:photosystem II stability/assembly factor-like uncharacterized protein